MRTRAVMKAEVFLGFILLPGELHYCSQEEHERGEQTQINKKGRADVFLFTQLDKRADRQMGFLTQTDVL